MNAIQEIERDFDWRETEIAMLRLMLANTNMKDRERLVLFRAAWALLYAHYEGFCKFALTVYYDSIRSHGLKCRYLPERTIALALNKEINKIKNLPSYEFFKEVIAFDSKHLDTNASFPDVDTESNLWPKTLEGLLLDADLSIESLRDNDRKLATLVSRRNKIAHGEREIITELDYYLQFEEAVTLLMCDLALAIDDKIASIVDTATAPESPT